MSEEIQEHSKNLSSNILLSVGAFSQHYFRYISEAQVFFFFERIFFDNLIKVFSEFHETKSIKLNFAFYKFQAF